MKTLFTILTVLFVGFSINAQSIEEMKSMQADKQAMVDDLQAQIDAAKSEIGALQKEIDKLAGWRKGLNGLVGFSMSNSNGWVANPNPDATSSALNIGINAFANRNNDKYFWNNKAVITKSWQDVDLTKADAENDDDGLFDNGTVDIFNIQSLYGYKLNDKLAVSAMADMNTSIENFLSPGVLDFGVGMTWTPSPNLTVVAHPINYHLAFSGVDGVDTEGGLGSKIRADFNQTFNVAGKSITYTSTLMTFIPYSSNEPTLFEYTWLNSFSFNVWKGIGVGIGFGLRNAEFESPDTQSYTNFGLSYGF